MKFESVLFAVAFLILAIISWPEEADSAPAENASAETAIDNASPVSIDPQNPAAQVKSLR